VVQVCTNACQAHKTNLTRLEELHVQLVARQGIHYRWVCPVSSMDTGKMAKRAFQQLEDFASLPSQTFLCRDMTSIVC